MQIAGGLAFICSNKIGPGHINHLDLGKLILGAYKLNQPELLNKVCADFQEAGVPCSLSDDLSFSRWQKLVWNVPFNGMTVVLNTTTDQIMANEATRSLALVITSYSIHYTKLYDRFFVLSETAGIGFNLLVHHFFVNRNVVVSKLFAFVEFYFNFRSNRNVKYEFEIFGCIPVNCRLFFLV